MSSSDLNIVLFGKRGVGKSSTGNSILDRKAFRCAATLQGTTKSQQKEITVLDDGLNLRVVDTPGYEENNFSMTDIKESMQSNPAGYHVMIIVLKFGERFTHEDIDAMEYLKNVFGDNFIKKYCIVVMSYGDYFKYLQEEGDIDVTFTEWCKQETGVFKALFSEVQERILLFNNYGSREQKAEQHKELVSMIDRLILGGRR